MGWSTALGGGAAAPAPKVVVTMLFLSSFLVSLSPRDPSMGVPRDGDLMKGVCGLNLKSCSGFMLKTTPKVGCPSLRVRASVSSPQKLYSSKTTQVKSGEEVQIAVLGASGYTGAEIVRLLANHPQFHIKVMTADRKASEQFGSVFPHLITQDLPNLVAIKDADFSNVDAEIIKGLPKQLKIVDLSADFRLRDINEYAEWYGHAHRAPELQQEAVYGLTEVLRDEIRNARLVANPGCYPTSIQLPLVPLIKAKLIKLSNIIIDAKSGKRGMQSTMFVEMAPGVTAGDLYQHLKSTYEGEEFVKLLHGSTVPHTRHVVGSNYCFMNVFEDRIPGRAIIISVIDNLVKGASGQAVQNLNLMMGLPENRGLQYQPLFP
uniref:Semialdehyde dehydrogenase NAD-binding domain-containing protein n=1 Tax=Oryza rufipogon TaxID=4529 RepID=A0A0E0R0T9_ORYRU